MTGDATVLVVEDTLVNRLALAKGVEREGHRVLQAENGREALAVLAEERIDMVLLDLLMPEMDGFDVLRELKSDPETRTIPVLVISAVEATEDVARAIELGAVDCLPKPFDPVILSVRLRTALEQARLRRVEQDYLRQELALRQQERLATLGRLSAGLGHELNNPASAALSSARRLGEALEEADGVLATLVRRPDADRIVAALDGLRVGDPPATAVERESWTGAIEQLLRRFGVTDSWSRADVLVAAGVTAENLASVVAEIPDGADVAVAWFCVRSTLTDSVQQATTSIGRIAELTAALRGYTYLDRAPQQDVDVHAALDSTLAIMSHKLPPGVEVVRDYADDIAPIHAYGGQLNQVWTNLIDNAIDAVRDEGRITLRTRAHGDGVVVEIADDGHGIPDDLRGQIFDPFVTTKPPGEGTGLGLNITHQIVTEVHGGRIMVESQPGATVFRVSLPGRPPTSRSDDS